MLQQGIPLFGTALHERDAFRAIFSFGGTLSGLDPSAVGNMPAALNNARQFTAEAVAMLKQQQDAGENAGAGGVMSGTRPSIFEATTTRPERLHAQEGAGKAARAARDRAPESRRKGGFPAAPRSRAAATPPQKRPISAKPAAPCCSTPASRSAPTTASTRSSNTSACATSRARSCTVLHLVKLSNAPSPPSNARWGREKVEWRFLDSLCSLDGAQGLLWG